jgi:hypothetical protein
MTFRHRTSLACAIALASCGPQRQPQEISNNAASPILPAPSAPPAVVNSEAPPANRAAEQQSSPEPNAPIDPKGVEAAGQVVQHYGALIEQHRLADAAKLWGDSAAAAEFARTLKHPPVHLEMGQLGQTEGAAGSIYTTIPVTFYGNGFRQPANIILRRVNDVPGSSEAQRRWHIERIEWTNAARSCSAPGQSC